MNILVLVFLGTYDLFLLGKYIGMELQEHKVGIYLVL